MSFSSKFMTLRSGNSFVSRAQPEMSAHEEEITGEVEMGTIESNEEISISSPPDLVGERIKASLEPFHAQISALTELVDHLFQSNSARETATARSRETRHQYELSYSGVPGSSNCSTVAPLANAGYLPDTGHNMEQKLVCMIQIPKSCMISDKPYIET